MILSLSFFLILKNLFFVPLILALGRQRQFSLLYRVSSSTARATRRNTVSKNNLLVAGYGGAYLHSALGRLRQEDHVFRASWVTSCLFSKPQFSDLLNIFMLLAERQKDAEVRL